MIHFITMAVCLLAGQFIRRYGKFSVSRVRVLNIIILWVSLPALIFVEVPSLFREQALSRDILIAVAVPWFLFLTAAGFIFLLGKYFKWSRKIIGALVLTAGLGNTSFVGIPVIEALFGDGGIRIAILIDQLGTFLILGTLGLIVASACAGQEIKIRRVFTRILIFPPFLSLVLAVLWGISSLPVDGIIMTGVLKKIGATLAPLALLSVGWQLELSRETMRRYSSELTWGLGFKLILGPALALLILGPLFSAKNLIYQVAMMEGAMAPMITGAVVASEFNLESPLAQLMVGLGIPISFVTLLIVRIAVGTGR